MRFALFIHTHTVNARRTGWFPWTQAWLELNVNVNSHAFATDACTCGLRNKRLRAGGELNDDVMPRQKN